MADNYAHSGDEAALGGVSTVTELAAAQGAGSSKSWRAEKRPMRLGSVAEGHDFGAACAAWATGAMRLDQYIELINSVPWMMRVWRRRLRSPPGLTAKA
jgi:hypothetical protein